MNHFLPGPFPATDPNKVPIGRNVPAHNYTLTNIPLPRGPSQMSVSPEIHVAAANEDDSPPLMRQDNDLSRQTAGQNDPPPQRRNECARSIQLTDGSCIRYRSHRGRRRQHRKLVCVMYAHAEQLTDGSCIRYWTMSCNIHCKGIVYHCRCIINDCRVHQPCKPFFRRLGNLCRCKRQKT